MPLKARFKTEVNASVNLKLVQVVGQFSSETPV